MPPAMHRDPNPPAGPLIHGGLEAVFLAHRPALLRFLRARGAGDAAEDLLQELWVRASSASAGPIADPAAYLYRSANNLLLDLRRSEQRTARRDDDWAEATGRKRDDAFGQANGERALISREQLQAAEAALAELGERTDVVFRRFRLDGVSQREIAEEQGISLSAVEKHLQKAYRALLQLRRQLDAD